jgi:CubicO group peptidase (beta-lactamase class C family)
MKKLYRILIAIMVLTVSLSLVSCVSQNNKYDIRNYSIVYSKDGSSEYQNYGTGTTEHTVFELGSNGKTVAAYIALKMVDEGVFDLDTRIYQYLDPELQTDDPRLKEITLEQLLCHTAGFSPSYELGVDKKIYSAPGEQFRYSGVGYIYLQNVIENAGGMTMDQAASKYVFGPMGMKNSPANTPMVEPQTAALEPPPSLVSQMGAT